MNIKDYKNSLRKNAKSYRKDMTECVSVLYAQKIHDNLRHIPAFISSNNILMYASLPGEVETLSLIQKLLNEGKNVYCPKTDKTDMHFYQIHSLDDLKEGNFHVLEPSAVSNQLLHLLSGIQYCMIVPGLLFDQSGNRLGYGKGYYDKYLSCLSDSIQLTTIAFSYDAMVKDCIPAEENDIKMHYIVTERQIYNFKK